METEQVALPAETHTPDACPNCGTQFHDDFCAHCGEQRHHVEELAFKHFLLHATHDLTHLDAKIFATLRYLFTRPGFLTQEFLAGRRTRYMRPFSLFLVVCTIFFLVDSIKPLSGYDAHQFIAQDKTGKIDAAFEKLAEKKHLPKEKIIERVQDTLHRVSTAAQLLNVLAMALVLAVLIRRRYFVEHLVFSLHFLSFTYLASLLLFPLSGKPGVIDAGNIAHFVGVTLIFAAYLFVSMRRIYGESTVATFFKTVVTYAITQIVIVGMLTVAWIVAVVRASLAK